MPKFVLENHLNCPGIVLEQLSKKKCWDTLFFGPTPTGRIRTYKFALVSVSLSLVSVRQIFSETAHWNFLIFFLKLKKMGKKVTFSLFPKNSKMPPYWPILTKIDPNFAKMTKNGLLLLLLLLFFFLKTTHCNFLIFCTKPIGLSRKKLRFCFFVENC